MADMMRKGSDASLEKEPIPAEPAALDNEKGDYHPPPYPVKGADVHIGDVRRRHRSYSLYSRDFSAAVGFRGRS
jgi:hypothetical protein